MCYHPAPAHPDLMDKHDCLDFQVDEMLVTDSFLGVLKFELHSLFPQLQALVEAGSHPTVPAVFENS